MGTKITTDEFKRRATALYKGVYDYTDTVLDNGSKSRITFVCAEHGVVEQLANGHLQGKGCGWCGGTRKLTPDMVRNKILATHKEKYSYDGVDFSVLDSKQGILCAEHGPFKQSLRDHLRGNSCPACGLEKSQSSRKLSTEDFICKAKAVHAGRYDYSKVVYKSSETKVQIVCSEHGSFYQEPHSHLKGSGCKKCGTFSMVVKQKDNGTTGWSYSDWEKAGSSSSNFKGFSLYVIECISKTERFIKVGKTFTDIGLRFKALPYKFKVCTLVYHNAYAISTLEDKIHRQLKEYSYSPSKDFAGKTECYTINASSIAIAMAEDGYTDEG